MPTISTTQNGRLILPGKGGFYWGFTTREGGTSQPPYETNNLADHVGDNPEAVTANRRLLLQDLAPDKKLHWFSARQIHGITVHEVTAAMPAQPPEADILVCRKPGFCLGIMVADCVPVIFIDPVNQVYGVAHCGWRGTVAHGVTAAIRALVALGAQTDTLQAAIGPAIGPCCFTTGADVFSTIRQAFPKAPDTLFTPNADLKGLCRWELLQNRIRPENIYFCPLCTCCNPKILYSYRKNNLTGRFAGYVALPNS